MELRLAGVQDPSELESTFSTLAREHVQVLVVFPDGMFLAHIPLINALAARNRFPTLYGVRDYVTAGGLMSYGANLAEMHRQFGASFADKILRGASPANLPVAQPTKLELLINLRTARILGLTIPQSLLVRADQLIE